MLSIENVKNSVHNNESVKFHYYDELGRFYFLYVGLFAIFSIAGFIPNDILLAAVLLVFVCTPISEAKFLYIFSLPWMSVATFSFGLSLSMLQSVILFLRILVHKKSISIDLYEFVYLFSLLFSGLICFIKYTSFTGLSFVFYFLIANEFEHENRKDNDTDYRFWRLALFSILISCFFAAIYGFTHRTSIDRWIKGLGYASQFYGTMGTTRFGLYLCICNVFAMYFVRNKWVKRAILVSLAVGVLATVSITALILLIVEYMLFYLLEGRFTLKKLSILIFVIIALAMIFIFWDSLAEIYFLKPVTTRIDLIIQQTKVSDFSDATSGRTELASLYLYKFTDSSLFSKFFGYSTVFFEGENYSHNSYIDMLLYSGVIGVALGAILQIKRFSQHRDRPSFKIYMIVKILILLSAATVSIFSVQYWQIWFYI